MEQVKLNFEPVRARKRDTETSQRSAGNARQFAAGHMALILDALIGNPGTIKEIAARTGLDHVAVARRMSELRQAGKVVTTLEERAGCREWRLA